MAVLITGATGYIGHQLTKRLMEQGESVTAILRPSSIPDHLRALGGDLRIHIDDGTLGNLDNIFDRDTIETVFHLAAHRSRSGAEDHNATLQANVHFSTRLWHAARKSSCQAFVNTGSYWQFGRDGKPAPNSFYAETKQMFQDTLTDTSVTLVLFDVYGSCDWRGGITAAFGRAAQGEPTDMSGGKQVLDMVHVSDVVDGFLNAASLLKCGSIGNAHQHYFLSSGQRMPLRDIATVFEASCGRPLALNWGALDYSPNQIFHPCPAQPTLPEWRPACSLEAGFDELIQELNLRAPLLMPHFGEM